MQVAIGPDPIALRVSTALNREAGHLRNAIKLLARRTGYDPRAVRNWFYGVNAPRAQELVALMIECDEVAAEINKMVAEGKARRCTPSI